MRHTLRHGLSYCLIDGRAIFLDVDKDRYFRLGPALEAAFLRHAEGCRLDEATSKALADLEILVVDPSLAQAPRKIPIAPRRSVLETDYSPPAAGVAAVIESAAIVLRTRRDMRVKSLKDTVDELERASIGHPLALQIEGCCESRLFDAASKFNSARLHVPIETCCLLDSLAMTRFLARRGFATNIVFGVIDDPFSAHCWVQAGDTVLNDTVGNVTSYTPIRVV